MLKISEKAQIAILVDPDKTRTDVLLKQTVDKINLLQPDFVFVGGSTVEKSDFDRTVECIKSKINIPVIIFPGAYNQVHPMADGILFLSLISGRNPDYLIGHQVQAAHELKKLSIEVIPTGYILVDGGKPSSVSYVSQTNPIPTDQHSIAAKTAVAGELLGMKSIFLDAGSGALNPVPIEMIKEVKSTIDVPLIVGGGIKSIEEIDAVSRAGADVIVIGNKIEESDDFVLDLFNSSYLGKSL